MSYYNSGLRKISNVFKVIGVLALAAAIFSFLSAFTNGGEWVIAAFGSLLGGLNLIFLGYVGEAINDIRDNTSKENDE